MKNLQRSLIKKIKRYYTKKAVGYQRLYFLSKTYASPHLIIFLALTALNILGFVLSTINTVFTAATIDILTGHASNQQQDILSSISITGVSLNNVGSLAFSWMNLPKDTNQFKLVLYMGLVGFGVWIFRAILSYGTNLLGNLTGTKMSQSMQLGLFKHYMSFSIDFFNKNRAGTLISRMEADTSRVTGSIPVLINNFLVSPLLLLFYIYLTVQASWVLFASIIVAGATHHILSICLSKPMQTNTRNNLNVVAAYRSVIMEAFSNIRIVKSFAAERYEITKISEGLEEIFKVGMRGAVLGGIQAQGRRAINHTTTLIILIFSAHELYSGRINLSSCLLFIFICQSVVDPITQISGAYVTMQSMVTASKRVYKYFKTDPQIIDGSHDIIDFKNQICIQNLGFSYEQEKVIKNFNLIINRGETVALVGPSGAGKSTLVDLLLRFHDPIEGTISIDGVNLRQLKQVNYRKMFGVVSQESLLFNAGIDDNIGYGREGIDQTKIENAAKISNAHGFINEMPRGYKTFVGDRGIRLSGGQRQRIAIARAIVSDPKILILDEATSSLDSESERQVQMAIQRVTQNTTAIIIAHRLSTIINSDKIVVMNKGEIIDIGKHDKLLERCDLYRNLCKLQFNTSMEIAG